MINPSFSWPPPFTIRKSVRSKRISLRISVKKGLEIILPKNTSQKKALHFLDLKFDWVQKHLHLLQLKQQPIEIPTLIKLVAINEEWQVKLVDRQTRQLWESRATCHLYLRRDLTHDQVIKLLQNWLIKKARLHLAELLTTLSETLQLPFTSLSIRRQRSRWGSCTLKKEISLNCKLLLLPPEITYYIIVHELTHTIHFNHSPNFWAAVGNIVPNYRQLCRELKNIEQALPNWVY